MARITIGGDASLRITRRPAQQVVVNGMTRPDVSCVLLQQGFRGNPSRCVLKMPRYLAASAPRWGSAEVVVYASSVAAGDARSRGPVFRGWMRSDQRREDVRGSGVTVEAESIRGRFDGVKVGQWQQRGLIRYSRADPATGLATGWTLERVVENLFAGLEPHWATKVGLGDIGALRWAGRYVDLPDVTFSASGYWTALRHLLGLAPDVGVAERYTEQRTLLDFYVMGRPGGYHVVSVPTPGGGPELGETVTAWQSEEDDEEVYSRVVGYGGAIETQVTVGTANPGGTWPAVCEAFLIPDWMGATAYPPAPAETLTAAEQAVLENPALASPGDAQFRPEYGGIFRRFRLPECLRYHVVEQGNLARDLAGLPIGRQVFIEEYEFNLEETGGKLGTLKTDGFRQIQGARYDPKTRVLELSKPAVAVAEYVYDSGAHEYTRRYARANVWATLTIQETWGRRLRYDTGVKGDLSLPGLGMAGITDSFVNEQIQYERVGSGSGEFVDSRGRGYGFGSIWWDETVGIWQSVGIGAPVAIQDDSRWLRAVCEGMLAERCRRRQTWNVRFPAALFGFRIGDGLRILNRGVDGLALQIIGVKVDLENCATEVTATNQVPWTVEAALAGRLERRMGPGATMAGRGRGVEMGDQGGLGGMPEDIWWNKYWSNYRPPQGLPTGIGMADLAGAGPSGAAAYRRIMRDNSIPGGGDPLEERAADSPGYGDPLDGVGRTPYPGPPSSGVRGPEDRMIPRGPKIPRRYGLK